MNTSTNSEQRTIAFRTRGTTHGPITRLMSPGDLGNLLKPFVFLDLVDFKSQGGQKGFGMHPHSGLATLTFLLEGDVVYEDTTGKSGVLPAGGVEWMRAGNGVWHKGGPVSGSRIQGFQLWVALPPNEENAPAQSLYLSPSEVPQEGQVRVMLGRYGAAQSLIPAPSDMTYLAVRLKSGERWSYTPPAGHTVAWLAVNAGQINAFEPISAGELVIFKESGQSIDVIANEESSFVLGSAVKHPYELVTGSYSVHTNKSALEQGEAEIRRIGAVLRSQGRLS
ncbi:pirin family protein [Undibacterium sp. Xuan67W]|uniref:pirin family protein n=1 Tax=Undibacterium sp. Xuan67W TaxID=3413057 RepID=UPI003BEFBB57